MVVQLVSESDVEDDVVVFNDSGSPNQEDPQNSHSALSEASPDKSAGAEHSDQAPPFSESQKFRLDYTREKRGKKIKCIFEYERNGQRQSKTGTLSAIGKWLLSRGMADGGEI